MHFRLFAVALAAFFYAGSALAQNQGTVTSHAFAIGKGAGTTGYTSLLCGSAQLAVGQSAADPICRTISGDATLSAAGAITLATVNSNVGSFGSATQCTAVTVNAKGLITAASQTTCTPAVGSITGLGTGVATALGINIGSAGAFITFNGALGTPSSGVGTNLTSLNATNLASGTVAAARMPALTGDCTTSVGTVATTCTGINGVNQNAAWTSYSPTITSGAGTITASSATGRYKQIGKTVIVEVDVTITTAGTGASTLRASLPLTAAAFEYVGMAMEIQNTGKSGAARIAASATTMNALDATGATFIASSNVVVMTAVYEVP